MENLSEFFFKRDKRDNQRLLFKINPVIPSFPSVITFGKCYYLYYPTSIKLGRSISVCEVSDLRIARNEK